ncbi:MAG: response regulator [Bryobacteraceae bacterium]
MSQIIGVVTDLFFTVKVIDAAKKAGLTVKFVKSAEAALEKAREGARLLVVDLNCRDVDTVDLIRRMREDPALAAIPALGFLSHVQESRKQEALAAGCSRVVPRSVFSDRTAELLIEVAAAA